MRALEKVRGGPGKRAMGALSGLVQRGLGIFCSSCGIGMTVADGSDGDFSSDHGDDDAVLLVLLGCRVTVVVMAMTAVMMAVMIW